MLKKNIYKILLTLCLLTFLNCSKEPIDSNCLRVPFSVDLKFINTSNTNLIGVNKKYNPSSISILNSEIFFNIDSINSSIEVYYDDLPSNTKIFLKLNSSDIDTIQVIYKDLGYDECGKNIQFKNIFYNNKEIFEKEISSYFEIIK